LVNFSSEITTQVVPTLNFFVGNSIILLTKDSSGNRVAVHRASTKDIIDNITPRIHILGLLSLLIDQEKGIGSFAKSPATSSKTTMKLGSSSETTASIDGGDNDQSKKNAKNELNALFGKRTTAPSSDADGGGDTSTDAAASDSNNTKEHLVKNDIPLPPPLPTSWPPIPYILSNAIGGNSDGGLQLGVGGTDMPVSASVTPKKSAPSKIKQIPLDELPVNAIEGTIWQDNLESFLPVEELFHDMDKEFAIIKLEKPKGKAVPASVAKTPKPEGALDPQRSQNINIMLAKFGRRTVTEIVQGILEFDAERAPRP